MAPAFCTKERGSNFPDFPPKTPMLFKSDSVAPTVNFLRSLMLRRARRLGFEQLQTVEVYLGQLVVDRLNIVPQKLGSMTKLKWTIRSFNCSWPTSTSNSTAALEDMNIHTIASQQVRTYGPADSSAYNCSKKEDWTQDDSVRARRHDETWKEGKHAGLTKGVRTGNAVGSRRHESAKKEVQKKRKSFGNLGEEQGYLIGWKFLCDQSKFVAMDSWDGTCAVAARTAVCLSARTAVCLSGSPCRVLTWLALRGCSLPHLAQQGSRRLEQPACFVVTSGCAPSIPPFGSRLE